MITFLTNGVRFHNDQYSKVDREREKRGLPHHGSMVGPESNRIYGHPLEGERIIPMFKRGKAYIVETVHQHWYFGGWYIHVVARVEGTQSHTFFWVENINSTNPFIIEAIEDFKLKYKFDRVVIGDDRTRTGSTVHASKNFKPICGSRSGYLFRKWRSASDREVNCQRCKEVLTSPDAYVE